MSDLLAKCEWDEDELHVELPQWPEVVYVWVDEKTMPYAPVVADVRSLQAENAKLQAEIAELEGTIECLKGLAEATGEENAKLRDENARLRSCLSDDAENARMIMGENAELRDQLEEQKCFAADLERDVRALRELVRHMRCCSNREYTEYGIDFIATRCEDCEYDNASGRCDFDSRMRELGVKL